MRSTDVAQAGEVWLRRQLHDYALAVRQLAYSLPNAAGERDLLQLSEQMNTTANQGLAERFAADPGAVDMLGRPDDGGAIEQIHGPLDVVPQALEVVVERFDVDVAAAAALLQKLSTATNTSVEHVARWLVRAGQPAGRPAAGHHT